jgi:hypothetical protein
MDVGTLSECWSRLHSLVPAALCRLPRFLVLTAQPPNVLTVPQDVTLKKSQGACVCARARVHACATPISQGTSALRTVVFFYLPSHFRLRSNLNYGNCHSAIHNQAYMTRYASITIYKSYFYWSGLCVWPTVPAEWLAFLLRIVHVTDTNLDQQTRYSDGILGFPRSLQENAGICLKSLHSPFHPHALQLIIRDLIFRRCIAWVTDTVVKKKHK